VATSGDMEHWLFKFDVFLNGLNFVVDVFLISSVSAKVVEGL